MRYGIIRKIISEDEIKTIQSKIDMLGKTNKKYDALEFEATRILTTILVLIISVILTDTRYYLIPFITIIYYFAFYYLVITYPLKKRIRDLDKEALTFFEVLTLTLESGRNLENALEITVCNVEGDLSDEFKQALYETKLGKSLMESLSSLQNRIPSITINNIILNILQTKEFGNNIVEVMNNQVDYLRDKRLLEIKAQINKIPNKVSIISVLFIIPLILLIILGPLLIEFIG